MPPSLSVTVRREFLFSVILRKSEQVLAKILNAKCVSQSSCTLPPGAKKHIGDIEGQFLGSGFSGAYISNADFPESLVDVGYVEMAFGREQPFAYFSGGRSRNTKMLTASLAIAVAELVQSPIEDSGHHWIKKEEYSPNELLAAMIELASTTGPE